MSVPPETLWKTSGGPDLLAAAPTVGKACGRTGDTGNE
jgi:hypothetical protein